MRKSRGISKAKAKPAAQRRRSATKTSARKQNPCEATAAVFRQIAEKANDGIIILRGDERLYFNPKYLEMTGCRDEAELASCPPLSFVHPDDLEMVKERARVRLEKGSPPAQYEFRAVRRDGSVRWVEISSSVIDYEGQPAGLGYMRDVTERKHAEQALKESEDRFRQLAEASFEGIVIHDRGFILDVNQALVHLLSYGRAEFLGRNVLEFIAPESQAVAARIMLREYPRPVELRLCAKSGRTVIVEVYAKTAVYKGNPVRVVAIRDITERKAMEDAIKALAITDDLTGLHNRRGFVTLVEQHLKVAKRNGSDALLMFVDLDGLKEINDAFGHDTGDLALVDTAGVLRRMCRESDVIGRVGGDEFGVLALNAADLAPEVMSTRLAETIADFNRKSTREFTLSMSWGTILYDHAEPKSLSELMALADRLMYEKKRAGRVQSVR